MGWRKLGHCVSKEGRLARRWIAVLKRAREILRGRKGFRGEGCNRLEGRGGGWLNRDWLIEKPWRNSTLIVSLCVGHVPHRRRFQRLLSAGLLALDQPLNRLILGQTNRKITACVCAATLLYVITFNIDWHFLFFTRSEYSRARRDFVTNVAKSCNI